MLLGLWPPSSVFKVSNSGWRPLHIQSLWPPQSPVSPAFPEAVSLWPQQEKVLCLQGSCWRRLTGRKARGPQASEEINCKWKMFFVSCLFFISSWCLLTSDLPTCYPLSTLFSHLRGQSSLISQWYPFSPISKCWKFPGLTPWTRFLYWHPFLSEIFLITLLQIPFMPC